MKTMLVIRTSTKKDADFILKGKQENTLISFPKFRINEQTVRTHKKRIAKALKSPEESIFIAEISGKPCAFLWLKIEQTAISQERFGYMKSLWVKKSLREKKIGSALLKHAEIFLRAKKIPAIRTTYSITNFAIQKFVKKRGFITKRIIAEKKLG